jgi:predicted acylesterase/phospholipase RssA
LQARTGAPEEKIDLLVLSGGGSHGAWGAGVLRGWRENTANPRPRKFQVVTGVSTGALLATYAFLAEPADDDLLEEAYATCKTSDIYKKKFILSALFSDSLYNSKPLSKRIEKYITPATIDRVALAGQEGRRLYVGTINHDTGRLVIWDLTAMEYVLRLNRYGHFALSYIPPELPVTTSAVFDPKMMRDLYEAGRLFGRTKAKWDDTIPNLDLNRH